MLVGKGCIRILERTWDNNVTAGCKGIVRWMVSAVHDIFWATLIVPCYLRNVSVNCVSNCGWHFAGCALMFVHSVVCVTHWLVEYCWVYCGHANEVNLLLAAIPRLLLDVLLVFRDGHYSQETLALYAEVGTGAASCCSEHFSTEWQQHSTVHTMENVQLIFVSLSSW